MDITHDSVARRETARHVAALTAIALVALPSLGSMAAATGPGSDVVHQYDVGVGFDAYGRSGMLPTPVTLQDGGTGAGGDDGQVSVGGSWFYDEEWPEGATDVRLVVEDDVFPGVDFAFSVNYCTPYLVPGSDDPTDLVVPDLPPSVNDPVPGHIDTYDPEWMLCELITRVYCGDTGQIGIRPNSVAIQVKFLSVEYNVGSCGHAFVPTQGNITGTFA